MQPADGADGAWRAVARLFGGETPDGPSEALPPALARRLAAVEPRAREAEYVRLFVNALPEVPCPPYASVELEGTLYGSSTSDVRALYRRWGVDTDEVPDHFAVEAAFLAGLLSGAEEDRVAAADAAWLAEHLRAWAPPFLEAVEKHDRTGVYAEAARWARSLLDDLGS